MLVSGNHMNGFFLSYVRYVLVLGLAWMLGFLGWLAAWLFAVRCWLRAKF